MPVLKQLGRRYNYLTRGFYLAYYFKSHHPSVDNVSHYLLDFKDGREPITSRWIEIASDEIRGELNPDLILRVLESEETEVSNHSPLDRLGNSLSESLDTPYRGRCLYKTRTTRPLKYLNKQERFDEINEVYRYRDEIEDARDILLIDDIVTSGTTIREIKRAISNEIGNFNLYLFVLGKTYDDYVDNDADNTELSGLLE
jgi:hypothetical protein